MSCSYLSGYTEILNWSGYGEKPLPLYLNSHLFNGYGSIDNNRLV